MEIAIRPFELRDAPLKIRWINDPANNRYLHYVLPLTEEGTRAWYDRVEDAPDRFDGVITADGMPCGLIGLLRINDVRKDAELYIVVGEQEWKRKGVASEAIRQLLFYAFARRGLSVVYGYTEPGNLPAQKLFAGLGFSKVAEGLSGVYPDGKQADCFNYRK
ncbi:MAG: GNAT family N-acetyltransferase [Clostridia bacterium]|nr:GNAT family N-acetyltransferase [Clostridia bacterium]